MLADSVAVPFGGHAVPLWNMQTAPCARAQTVQGRAWGSSCNTGHELNLILFPVASSKLCCLNLLGQQGTAKCHAGIKNLIPGIALPYNRVQSGSDD